MTYTPARQRTLYFIGVTTSQSSIMKVFPRWSEALGLDAVIKGIDFTPNDDPARYREAVAFIKADPLSMGALVTTHKVNLLKASRDLFDDLDPYAQTLGEISGVSKRGGRLWGHAKDPITVGCSLEAIVEDGYWRRTGAEMIILGAGGSSMALTLFLHNKAIRGGDTPGRITVTARREQSLAEIREAHRRIGFAIPVAYAVTPEPTDADRLVAALPKGSMVVNATGLGKDRPGSPLTDAVAFPGDGIAWEFNYRGELIFLDQARAARARANLRVEDGWVYFIHGWTRVIAEVFDTPIAVAGPKFDRLSQIALSATKGP
ncbi:shikimate 5-dehydrogenase [Roseiarcus fermentans]|uniref:Shikimate 5-dehydrogenase n=1 Tax=Roseiarcus fermentans TaxID=1473586 RepID=A0A366FU20_9HYPH|nr:shikimate dehydrogenase [Roseiarcus fermentans]RBP18118.1 shikimate 5-dehydrogenase [Roseiarcus fermentans]